MGQKIQFQMSSVTSLFIPSYEQRCLVGEADAIHGQSHSHPNRNTMVHYLKFNGRTHLCISTRCNEIYPLVILFIKQVKKFNIVLLIIGSLANL